MEPPIKFSFDIPSEIPIKVFVSSGLNSAYHFPLETPIVDFAMGYTTYPVSLLSNSKFPSAKTQSVFLVENGMQNLNHLKQIL